MKTIDVILLANSDTDVKYDMTQACINSILASSRDLQFNIVVTETHRGRPSIDKRRNQWTTKLTATKPDGTFIAGGAQYKAPGGYVGPVFVDLRDSEVIASFGNATEYYARKPMLPVIMDGANVVYQGARSIMAQLPFNYNQCIFDGMKEGHSDWVFVMNNDTLVHPGAFDLMVNQEQYDSVSPMTTINTCWPQFTGVKEGYWICREVMGFCIGAKRSLMEKLHQAGWDYRYFYFHEDCCRAMLMRHMGIKHACYGDAHVDHLQGQSHPPTPTEQAWALESTRRFYHQFPEDYGVFATGDHSGGWTKDQIFDKIWYTQYTEANPQYFVGYGDKNDNSRTAESLSSIPKRESMQSQILPETQKRNTGTPSKPRRKVRTQKGKSQLGNIREGA